MLMDCDALDLDLYGYRAVAPIAYHHDAPFCYKNVHMLEYFYYKVVHCEIFA